MDDQRSESVTGADWGTRVYDWWSRHPRLLEWFYDVVFLGREAEFRRRAVDALELEPGERVLELGCGAGNAFESLRADVGAGGLVVGVDYSQGMARRAATRIHEAGWDNAHVARADAARPGVEDSTFDAVYAAMSVSAMPDPTAVFEAAYAALRPGGRIVVLDARPFQDRPWSLLNPVVIPASKLATNWVSEEGVDRALEAVFDEVSVSDFHAGALFVATGRKRHSEERRAVEHE